MILPLPGLDFHAGKTITLANEDEELAVSQADFNKQFQFIHNDSNLMISTTVAFLSSMMVFALLFIGVLSFYCCKLRHIDDNDDETAEMDGLVKNML
jgi:hypothetical protein